MSNMDRIVDCVIIGGGPAGLSAAIYLARFRRTLELIDACDSRAAQIPLSHNYPGFPDGINGMELLARMREQARHYGVHAIRGTVERIEKTENGEFLSFHGGGAARSRTVLLATGMTDIEPDMPELREAVRRGLVRYCPICDGYEAQGRKVGVIGYGTHCIAETMFIRHFTEDLTVLTLGREMRLSDKERQALEHKNIRIIEEPIAEVSIEGDKIEALRMRSGKTHRFDTVYSMLGVNVRSDLATALGANCDEDGNLFVDRHLQTSIDGLYAAGDVVDGLNQISVATGHAAIAATAIHNRL
jgi:thioredoxin reductase (NADPH)